MATAITTWLTPQGLLIPRSAIRGWLDQGVEVIEEQQRIIIQPKSTPRTERERMLYILEAAGLLCYWRNLHCHHGDPCPPRNLTDRRVNSASGNRCLKSPLKNEQNDDG